MVSKALAAAGAKRRAAIAAELMAAERILTASPTGRQVLKACRIEQFRRSQDAWAASWAGAAGGGAKAGALADILAVVDTAQPRARQK